MSVTVAPRSRGIALPRVSGALAAGTLGAGLVAIELAVRGETDLRRQIVAQLVAFAVFLPAAWLCWRGLGLGRAGVVLVAVVALALRIASLDPSAPPPLTTDTYRYAWDARVQAAGINPYRYPTTAPELRDLRDAKIWPNVNHPTWRTVYPPGAEATFLAARVAFGNGVRATTWLFLLAEAGALGLLVLVLARTGAPLERVALAAWHPLAVSEIAGNGHADALAVLAGAALLAAWVTRARALAGLAVGYGALVKLGPVLLVPALARRGGRRFVAAALGSIAVAYAAYGSVGRDVLGDLPKLIRDDDLGSFAWYFLSREIGKQPARALLLVALLAVVAFVALRAHDHVEQVARTCLLVLGGVLLASSLLQPWYALWLLPFLVVTAAPAWLWLTGTVPLLYAYGLVDGPLPWWVRTGVYAPFFALAALHLVRPRRAAARSLVPLASPRVAAVIPVLNEVEALPGVLRELSREAVDEVVVVDGGSTDGTPEAAEAAGARVVHEPRRGYGRACLTGAESTDAEVVVFLDGDGSDDPADLSSVLAPVLAGEAALALGRRAEPEPGGMHVHQRLGNGLVSALVRWWYGAPIRDIPPFRAARRDVLHELALTEMTFGWPTEMVVKAACAGFPIAEVEVASRPRRGGESKVSGRLGPSLRAGACMLGVAARFS